MLMMNLRRLFLICVTIVCQFPSHIALASSHFRLDEEHFSLRLDATQRFIEPAETVRIMIEDWGNPAAQVMEQNPLGMIVDQDFPKGSSWGIIITASHDGHIADKDANRISDSSLIGKLRREYLRMNKQRKAAGTAPVTSLHWALEPQYDSQAHHIIWAKKIGFGNDGTRTVNYAARILGRENTIHFNAVGSMDQLDAIARSVQSVLTTSAFDEGFRYRDYDARYHRTADYGLVALIAGQPKLKTHPLQNLWARLSSSSNLMGSSHLTMAVLFGLTAALGRWLTRRRLPEF